MGEAGADIKLSAVGKLWFPFSVECKNNKDKWKSVYDAYGQNNDKDLERLLIIKRDNKQPLAVVDAEFFIKVYRLSIADVLSKYTSDLKLI